MATALQEFFTAFPGIRQSLHPASKAAPHPAGNTSGDHHHSLTVHLLEWALSRSLRLCQRRGTVLKFGTALALAGLMVVIGTPVVLAADPAGACFEVDDPMWAHTRATAGEMGAEQAERYRCDPRLVNQDLAGALDDPGQIKVTITRAPPMDEGVRVALEAAAKKPKKPKTKCVEGYILTKEMGSATTAKRFPSGPVSARAR